MSFKIKDVTINGKLILAPMAGVSNLEYRKMCIEYGANYTISEMISDKGIYYNDKKTLELLNCEGLKHPYAIQIFGGDLDTLVYAAKYVDKNTDCDVIDINMGCPVPKIIRSDAGSKYLQDPDRIYNTISEIVKNVNKPVSVKIRIGWDHNSINVLEVSEKIKKAGASAITIHGRTKTDLYSGSVNYDLIRQVKEKLGDFPVIANGDIKDPKTAKWVLEYTKCDAIMIGRGSYGNPFIFRQIQAFLDEGILLDDLKMSDKKEVLLKYAYNLMKLKGEVIAMRELRAQAGWFIKGAKNSAKIRNLLSTIETFEDLKKLLKEIE